jgi:hypothetical protein
MTEAAACTWCNSGYIPRTTGGHIQRFCRSACRRAFDAAGRRWVAEAIAGGILTLDSLRNGAVATRALLSETISPAPVSEPQKPAAVAPAESADEAAELLDDFLIALLDLPSRSVGAPCLWTDIALALPDGLFDRIDHYLEARLS